MLFIPSMIAISQKDWDEEQDSLMELKVLGRTDDRLDVRDAPFVSGSGLQYVIL